MTPPVYTVQEFERAFKICHTRAYEEINSGRLQTYNVGRRRYISGRAAEAWQRSYEDQSGTAPASDAARQK